MKKAFIIGTYTPNFEAKKYENKLRSILDQRIGQSCNLEPLGKFPNFK